VIFRAVREGKPYPEHGLTTREWAQIPPRPVRLDQLVTIKRNLALDRLLAQDSTFYGDLFPHVVQWQGELYLEDGLHRALRAALQQRTSIHARVLVLPLPGRSIGQAEVPQAPREQPATPPPGVPYPAPRPVHGSVSDEASQGAPQLSPPGDPPRG
jgi:Arc/MetJ family transcription regulator